MTAKPFEIIIGTIKVTGTTSVDVKGGEARLHLIADTIKIEFLDRPLTQPDVAFVVEADDRSLGVDD